MGITSTVLEGESTPHAVNVQLAGEGYRLSAALLEETAAEGYGMAEREHERLPGPMRPPAA